jgi:hypothetical protein
MDMGEFFNLKDLLEDRFWNCPDDEMRFLCAIPRCSQRIWHERYSHNEYIFLLLASLNGRIIH